MIIDRVLFQPIFKRHTLDGPFIDRKNLKQKTENIRFFGLALFIKPGGASVCHKNEYSAAHEN